MGTRLYLGKLFNIKVYLHYSLILIFLLVTFNLAVGVFPALHPDWSNALYWVLGTLASVLFFSSVLAHEFAHSLTAKKRGLEVRDITLFIFGGMASIEDESPSPLTEFLITIAGPITSFVLGFLFLLASGIQTLNIAGEEGVLGALASLSPMRTVFLWLGWVNIILAIFNLIPGYPLDGGRIFRSVLWAITGNVRSATKYASWLGRLVAWSFVALGAGMILGISVPVLGTGLGGIWLMFIGLFLNFIARKSYEQTVLKDLLEKVSAEDIMKTEFVAVPPNITLQSFINEYLMQKEGNVFPVFQEGELKGWITIKEVQKVPKEEWANTYIEEVMRPGSSVKMIDKSEDAMKAFRKLNQQELDQLPVVEEGNIVGFLSLKDISKWLKFRSNDPEAGQI
jgi:Zn-dependent protease/predicted transcriptional regulator